MRSLSHLLELLLSRASPSPTRSRHRPLAYAPPSTMPIAWPVGQALLQLRLPERSCLENNDVHEVKQPHELDPEREESLEDMTRSPSLCSPWDVRHLRVGAPSEGERSVESAQTCVLGRRKGGSSAEGMRWRWRERGRHEGWGRWE